MTEPNEPVTLEHAPGLSLAAFRALRYTVDGDRLGPLLCPPYDVIDDAGRELLLAGDDHNAVGLILPRAAEGADANARAAADLTRWVARC